MNSKWNRHIALIKAKYCQSRVKRKLYAIYEYTYTL